MDWFVSFLFLKSLLQRWLSSFEEHKCMAFGVNSHNRDNIREVNVEILSNLQGSY